jgi:hypothetical protein
MPLSSLPESSDTPPDPDEFDPLELPEFPPDPLSESLAKAGLETSKDAISKAIDK